MTRTSCHRPSLLAINRARHLGELIDRRAPKPMLEMNTSLVTPTSSSVWLEGALELCELIQEASYVLTDGIGGFPHAASFRWLVRMLQGEGAIMVFNDPDFDGCAFSRSWAIRNRLRLFGPEGSCPTLRTGFPKTGAEEGNVYACLFRPD
ncbi:hypothetical protein N7504_006759 [Penicillium tannophilum]|nr:hypothetical protein N7504_006759 [Penicillium tannophilum]